MKTEDQWPEDEAALTFDTWKGRIENGWTVEENREALARDIAHMARVFDNPADNLRYLEELERRFTTLIP